MTIPTTTSGALCRVRSWAAAAAVVALGGALAAAGAQADPHPDHRPTYKVTADLDGRATPAKGDDTTIVEEDFLRKGEKVRVICQANGGLAYGSRIWDLVPSGNDTLFVPDRFIKTGTNGRAPEIRRCTKKDLKKVTAPEPYPQRIREHRGVQRARDAPVAPVRCSLRGHTRRRPRCRSCPARASRLASMCQAEGRPRC